MYSTTKSQLCRHLTCIYNIMACLPLPRRQTHRSLKICIAHSVANKGEISNMIFFAGYASGSSLGFASVMAMYLLLQCRKDAACAACSDVGLRCCVLDVLALPHELSESVRVLRVSVGVCACR